MTPPNFNTFYFDMSVRDIKPKDINGNKINQETKELVTIVGVARSLKPNIYMVVCYNHNQEKLVSYDIKHFNKNFITASDTEVKRVEIKVNQCRKNNKIAKSIGTINNINLKTKFDVFYYEASPTLLFCEIVK